MNALKRFIGSGFGSGLSPYAPGTAGSIAALIPIYFSFWFHPVFGPLLIVVLASLLTYWTTPACEKAWGEDPGSLVMDEFAGQALVFVSVSLTTSLQHDWKLILLGFVFFRFFDILKPLGINKLQKLHGATGVLLDDLLAGFYGLMCVKSLIFFFPDFF